MKTHIKQTIAQIVISSFKSYDPFILERWKAKNFISSGNAFNFDVDGKQFKGNITVAYLPQTKKFMATLNIINNDNKKKSKLFKRHTDIDNLEDITKILDNSITGEEENET